jgi:hypothetical protein
MELPGSFDILCCVVSLVCGLMAISELMNVLSMCRPYWVHKNEDQQDFRPSTMYM